MAAPLALIFTLLNAPASLKAMGDLMPSIGIRYQRWALSKFPVNLPTIQELIEMRYRGELDDNQFLQFLAENGMNEDFALKFLSINKTILSASDYINLYRRGEITETTLFDNLSKLHIDKETGDKLLKATEFYPNPSDLVRFAVREVFTPTTAQKFGQYEDFPEQFVSEAAKVGLSKENALRYWAAHWELPSPNMGFEMFQRRIINKDDLLMLLKSLDIMPYWRDKLIDLSYSPLTRVDIRRMYGLGVLDETQVYNAYLDIGYSPENAKLLLQYTVADTLDNEKSASKSQWDKALKSRLIDITTYRNALIEMGYTDQIINMYANQLAYDMMLEDVEADCIELKSQYKNGLITIQDVENYLNKKDLPSTFVKTQVAKIKTSVSDKVKLPVYTDLIKWLNYGIIDEVQFRNKMSQIGYMPDDIECYLKQAQKSAT